jgi:RHS repeat-associated protein
MIGIVSSFQYDATDFINQMTTPYGSTSFIQQAGPGNFLSLETHYPMGEKERVEFKEAAPGIVFSEASVPTGMPLFNQYISYRTTFYWDKKAMKDAPGDYTKARILHWLHGNGATGENGYAAPILESVKDPLENRIWYDYQGQSSAGFANQGMSAQPSIIGRVLTDKTTQTSLYSYNTLGAVTSSTDPSGRKLSYIYDSSNINLVEVRQVTGGVNELLEQYTYNTQHLPLTKKDAAGQLTRFTYNAAGQVLTITNPKNETTTFTYDGSGYLTNITGPVAGSTVNFTYDGFGRQRTITNSDGYTITTDYDVLDRPTLNTYPDSSFEQVVYDRIDAVHQRDRLGRWTNITYDSLDRPILVENPLGQKTQYSWCNCGSLSAITDPLNHTTGFTLDVQGRLISKSYSDGKVISYQYDSTTSRLRQVTDAKGQKIQCSYYIDDNLKQVSYTNTLIATPSVSFTYDAHYNRVTTMTDGTGITTYGYNPVTAIPLPGAGLLATVDGPLSNDIIAYSYDSSGRTSGRAIDGMAALIDYDALGRMAATSNVLGTFSYHYIDGTNRLAAINYPNGQRSAMDYLDNTSDQHLKQVLNTGVDGSLLSQYGYIYNPSGLITQWTQQSGNSLPNFYELGYDAANQLVTATRKTQRPAATLAQYAYKYDNAGNRAIEHINNTVLISEYNLLNQLTRQWDADSLRTRGNIDSLAGNELNNTLSYDDNGNSVQASLPGVSYGWDGANRLVSITKGSNIIEFIYDGWSRRVAEKLNGNIIRRWIWDEAELAEERDASGATVTKRFFPQGEQINGVNYYFTTDHLGSVREMTDSSGTIRARYDYDPYGRRTKVSGDLDADFGFTGHYYHAASGLHLSTYRAYDAGAGRWLSRDPIGETSSLNLYNYVTNNPVNSIDPYGTYGIGAIGSGGAESGAGLGAGGTVFLGGGVFWGGDQGVNFGGFAGGGAFYGDHSAVQFQGQKPRVLGTYAGIGGGGFFTNATCVTDLGGPFKEYHLNLPWFSISYAVSGDIFIVSVTVGPKKPISSWGGSVSQYPTTTVPSNVYKFW